MKNVLFLLVLITLLLISGCAKEIKLTEIGGTVGLCRKSYLASSRQGLACPG